MMMMWRLFFLVFVHDDNYCDDDLNDDHDDAFDDGECDFDGHGDVRVMMRMMW